MKKEELKTVLRNAGAVAVGFSVAEPVPVSEWELFENWLSAGHNAGMDYMHNYPEIRQDPRLLLPNAKTIISMAFSYSAINRDESMGFIASYAFYPDYHKAIRKVLKSAVQQMYPSGCGVNWRICVDSAPILERYWARRSGIGFQGDSGMIIVPGIGSRVFLAEIITDAEFEPDEPLSKDCGHCGKCRSACPGNALSNQGLDCRRCISYLTIEHHGGYDEIGKAVMNTEAGQNTIFGCDRCVEACPWNEQNPPSSIPNFSPLSNILSLSKERFHQLTNDNQINRHIWNKLKDLS